VEVLSEMRRYAESLTDEREDAKEDREEFGEFIDSK
jgi:hypothetical protein